MSSDECTPFSESEEFEDPHGYYDRPDASCSRCGEEATALFDDPTLCAVCSGRWME